MLRTGQLCLSSMLLAQMVKGSSHARKELTAQFSAKRSSSETALCTHRTLLTCSFAEMDNTRERVDQRGREEVWRREVEGHLPEIPLPEPHSSDDQGSLADHEKAGNPLELGATGPSVQKPFYFSFERQTGAIVAERLLCLSLMCVGAGVVSPSGSWYPRLLQQMETAPDENRGAFCLKL